MIEEAKRLHSVKEYYFSKKLREVRQLIKEGKDVINLAIGSPDLSAPEHVVSALKQSVHEPNAHKYQSYQGLPELRLAISKFYQKHYQVELNPETEVLPLMGSKEGIMHISMAFLNAGDEVLIPNPGYPTYSAVTQLVQAKPLFYDLNAENNWLPDLKSLAKKDLSKVKMMWVNYPNMPTGAEAKDSFFQELLVFGKAHNILIVNDNPYSFILTNEPKSMLTSSQNNSNILELNSLSKVFNMAGWRVGMLVGDAELIASVLKVKSNMDSGMFYGIQKGAIKALHLEQTWFDNLNEIYTERREKIWQLADELKLTYDKNTSGLFVWAKHNSDQTSENITDELLYKHDIFITPGTVFGSNGEGYVRFSLCANASIIDQATQRVKKPL